MHKWQWSHFEALRIIISISFSSLQNANQYWQCNNRVRPCYTSNTPDTCCQLFLPTSETIKLPTIYTWSQQTKRFTNESWSYVQYYIYYFFRDDLLSVKVLTSSYLGTRIYLNNLSKRIKIPMGRWQVHFQLLSLLEV